MAGGKTLAQAMAAFAFSLRYDAIPPEVVAAARRLLDRCNRLSTVEDVEDLFTSSPVSET